jgi:hypothetical protein
VPKKRSACAVRSLHYFSFSFSFSVWMTKG